MTERPSTWLSYPVVMGLLVVLTIAVIFLGRFWNWGLATFYLLAIPLALAVAYLAWYRTLPYTPPEPRPSTGSVPVDGEPFEDPVEEADRLDEAKEADEKADTGADDDDLEDALGSPSRTPEDPDSP